MKRLIGLLAAVALLAAFPAPVSAATLTWTIYENTNWTGDNWAASGGETWLGDDNAGLHDGCNTSTPYSIGWNDCISSFLVSLGAGRCFALYTGADYSGTRAYFWRNATGSRQFHSAGSMGGYNDTISSIRVGVVSGSGCQWSPGG